MRSTRVVLAVALALSMGACTENAGTKETMGTLVGAGLGALAGSQIGDGKGQLAAVAIGTLAGAYIGKEVGKSLDRADRIAMQESTQNALEKGRSGAASQWRNPDSGNYGTVTPQPAFKSENGRDCREFQQTVTVDGETVTGYGTACRQDDGTWRIVSN
ncbi:MAG: RT0821/Lpp0805 family surface protein [Sphingomonadales bacterium]